ncbi:MAG TPA: hypothetical protein VMW17_12435 [Candidatus Binatia bacterium]|nr:hypothetical protein [Candidatus Binatia bacterium]
MRRPRDQRGFSFAEVLVTMVFALWLALMLQQFQRTISFSVQAQEQRGQAQELARIGIDLMARELRLAGYSGAGTPLLPLRIAGPTTIEVQADLNGNGAVTDSNEVVNYSYDAAKQALMRSTSGGSPQPMVDHVPAGAFQLEYHDGAGTVLAGTLTAAARAQVREVVIRLGVEFPLRYPAPHSVVVSHTERVQLRNAGL